MSSRRGTTSRPLASARESVRSRNGVPDGLDDRMGGKVEPPRWRHERDRGPEFGLPSKVQGDRMDVDPPVLGRRLDIAQRSATTTQPISVSDEHDNSCIDSNNYDHRHH